MATAAKPSDSVETQRPTPYPYYSLDRAIQVGEAIRDLGGTNGYVQKSMVAHRLSTEEDSPMILGVLGAARLFDIIEGRGTYRLTETGKQYFHPTTENERRLAMLRMVKSPPLFSALIEKFDGTRLPSNENLVNILHREHRISESWRTRAASLFVGAARWADIIDAAGFLRYKASLHTIESGMISGMETPTIEEAEKTAVPPTMVRPQATREVRAVASEMDVWTAKIGNESVRLETSPELSLAAWVRLYRYVQAMKPEGMDGE